MSLLDGKVLLDGERSNDRQNNGGHNNRQERRNNRRMVVHDNIRRGYNQGNNGNYSFSHSSYLPEDMQEQIEEEQEQQENKRQENDRRADAMNDFVDEFTGTQDFRKLREIMTDMLPDAVRHIKGYYNPNNNKMYVDAVNRLIGVAGTTVFSKALSKVLEEGDWAEDGTYDRIWRNVAFLVSTALETAYSRMHTDVVRKYATEILPRMWKPEINEITMETGVTKDLALDLIIAIPMVGSEWNGSNIDAFYGRFLDKMMIHAEDNMDILNWEVQGMLYDRFFGNGKKGNGKTALKVIGKYLVSAPKTEAELKEAGEVATAIYKEFLKMLYKKLDAYDIKDISYVFRFVADYRKDNPDADTTFNAADVKDYENVRKGLLNVMDTDKDKMEFLA